MTTLCPACGHVAYKHTDGAGYGVHPTEDRTIVDDQVDGTTCPACWKRQWRGTSDRLCLLTRSEAYAIASRRRRTSCSCTTYRCTCCRRCWVQGRPMKQFLEGKTVMAMTCPTCFHIIH